MGSRKRASKGDSGRAGSNDEDFGLEDRRKVQRRVIHLKTKECLLSEGYLKGRLGFISNIL